MSEGGSLPWGSSFCALQPRLDDVGVIAGLAPDAVQTEFLHAVPNAGEAAGDDIVRGVFLSTTDDKTPRYEGVGVIGGVIINCP